MNRFVDPIFEIVRKHPEGVSRRHIQSKMGVVLDNEEDRNAVWGIAAALAKLSRERNIVSEVVGGMIFYFPQSA